MRCQVAPLAERQVAQHHAADAHALQADDLQADQFAHAPDLALLALGQHKAQLLRVLPFDLGRQQGLPIQAQAVAQQRELFRGENRLHVVADRVVVIDAAELGRCSRSRAIGGGRGIGGGRVGHAGIDHAHQVFLFDGRVFADQLARNAAVLRQHQQSGRVDVQPACRHQALELTGVKEEAGVVLSPAVLRLYQCDGRLVAILGLTTDQAERLVDQHRDLVGLLAFGLLADLDAHIGAYLHAHAGDHAVDLDPALGNPVVGLAARGPAQFGHALVQAQRAVFAVGGGVALPGWGRHAVGRWRSAAEFG